MGRATGALARLRRARALHPDGVVTRGEWRTESAGPLPLPSGPTAVVARLSKGGGTRGAAADVLGLAMRLPGWDLTLSTAGRGRLGRVLPRPVPSWADARYSSLVPYRVGRHTCWLRAEPDDGQPAHSASTDDLAARLDDGPVRFAVYREDLRGRRELAGRLTLVGTDPGDPRFDPMLNRPEGVRLVPDWLSRLREWAYRGSRGASG
ncbi:hypothetical protein EWH70_12155 [Amycolatopsis suaedae]|uniref:Phosphodiesterase n=1 Tax=Amycolatopsis suaedae TaxID=2510978 RepID=A0A4Q7JCH5_9PSEU|nr:hypothetical protein EWH70_12155 [Amycolatopsis suaedae]